MGWVLAAVVGYLLGAVPTGVLICRLAQAPDVRQSGSGHTGGLNVTRSAGLWAGALTAIGDALLGAAAVTFASLITANPWAAAAAGVLAVIGHNWSAFIRFGGGIGLATLTGVMLGFSPLPAIEAVGILLPFWLVLIKLLRVHRARATILVMSIIGPLLWAFGLPWTGILGGALGGVVVILKTLPDWNRRYE
jgi:glycerol-3-phosphate acyltransferase PlsY